MYRDHVVAATSALLLSVCLSGCVTNLSTTTNRWVTAPAKALPGVTYALPMAQYDIVVTRTLATCPEPPKDGETEGSKLTFTVVPVATLRYVAGEEYLVNYERLNSPLKTAGFTIEYQDKSNLLKSINASASDQTGDVIKNIAKTGVSVAALGMGNPAPAVTQALSDNGARPAASPLSPDMKLSGLVPSKDAGGKDAAPKVQTYIDCSDQARAVLHDIADTDAQLKQKQAELAQATRRVTDLTTLANLKLVGSTDRADMIDAIAAQDKLLDAIAALQAARTEKLARISSAAHDIWPSRFDEYYRDMDPAPQDVLKLIGLLVLRPSPGQMVSPDEADPRRTADHPAENGHDSCADATATVETCLKDRLTYRAQLVAEPGSVFRCVHSKQEKCLSDYDYVPVAEPNNGPRAPTPYRPAPADLPRVVDSGDASPDPGIFVREPINGRLVTCTGKAECDTADGALSPVQSIPQLGQLRFLKFKNRPFEANELTVSLAENGAIAKLDYKRTASSAAAATAVMADVASQLKTAKDDREKARQDSIKSARDELLAEKKADVDLLQDKLDTITKEQAILKQQTPAAPDQDAAIKAQLATKDLERQLAEAELAQKKALLEYAALGQTP